MSKVKANLIKVNLKMGNFKLAVEIALRNNAEGSTTCFADGSEYESVYLDNAYSDVSSVLSRHQFAGYLAALAECGVYKTQGDDFFGMVRIKRAN